MFINLHGYSTFSFLEAVGTPKDIILKAKELGQPAIALTDMNVIYGAIQHYQVGQIEGIKPIIGSEIGFVLDINNIQNEQNIGSICFLAQNYDGYLNLLRLISFASQEGIAFRPKIDFKILEQCRWNILAFSGGLESWIAKMLFNGESLSKVQEIIQMLKQLLWEENFYLEIIAQDESNDPDIARINKLILELSDLTKTPCIISNIYAYPSQQDKITQELAMAIKDNLKLYDPSHRVTSTQNHIMNEQEIRSISEKNGYSSLQIDEWTQNTQKVADSCFIEMQMWQALFPNYQWETEIVNLYEKYKGGLISD